MIPNHEKRLQHVEDLSMQFNQQIAEITTMAHELPAQIKEAVKTGVTAAITDPQVHAIMWKSIMAQAQRGAVEHTGKWILKSVWSVVTRWILIGLIVVLFLKMAGLEATIKVLTMLGSK